jgi:rhodanese-related sulfurtransferase
MGTKLEQEALEPGRARELIAGEDAQVLDVRDEEEVADVRLAGAVLVRDGELDEALESIDEDHPVVVVCADGKRSGEVAADLRERGYDAACLKGGIKAWAGDKLPTLPRDAEEFHGPRRPGPLGS